MRTSKSSTQVCAKFDKKHSFGISFVTKHRFNTLDGMRGIAAIAVMMTHFSQHTAQPLFQSAGIAVDLFFCLSGFVIAFSYQSHLQAEMTLGQFLVKRLVRLYPMFILGLTIGGTALILKSMDEQTTFSLVSALNSISLNIFYIPYFGDHYVRIGNSIVTGAIFPANDPAWSLFFELAVNVIFCIWVLIYKNKSPLPIVLISGFALIAYVVFKQSYAPGWSATNALGGIPRTVYGFFIGVYIYHLAGHIRKSFNSINPLLIVLSIIIIFLIPSHHNSYISWLLGALVLVPLLVATGCISSANNKVIKNVFDYLGYISYPIYCLHFPIYTLFTTVTNNSDSGLWGVLICTITTVSLAHVSAKYIDEPVRAKLSNVFLENKPLYRN